MVETLPDGAELAALDKAAWLEALDDVGEDRGSFEPIGPRHQAVFTDREPVLLVTFETIEGVRARPSQLPLGFELADKEGWSQLTILADGDTWFRDRYLYGYFDRLVDDGFFEDFDRVVFLGAGACGYAACAFSVAAPGATVIALSPVSTLDPALAGWDHRFPATRRLSFTDRYGYAPDMIEAADKVFLAFDPYVIHDAVHAGAFARPNVERIRMRHFGDNPMADLIRMDLLQGLVTRAMAGELTAMDFFRGLRARRSYMPWLRRLILRLEQKGRNWRLAKAARAVRVPLASGKLQVAVARARAALVAEGRTLPPPLKHAVEAD